jgi:hypothetical protein
MAKLNPTMKLSLFQHTKDNKPKTIERPLDCIIDSLTRPLDGVTSKDSIPLWSPTIFEGTRSGANAKEIGFLVYDIDDGVAPVSCWRLFVDTVVICHTSFSHKPKHHKYRIIIPLEKPIPAKDWDRASIAGKEYWDSVVGRGEPDPKALKDVARIYYRYAIPLSDPALEEWDPRRSKFNHTAVYWDDQPLLNLDYSHVEIKKPEYKAKPLPRSGKIRLDDAVLDPEFRLEMAYRAGAQVKTTHKGCRTAKYITCPACTKNSVVFSVDLDLPTSIKWPKCNHENTCGWWGTFADLMG